ncbi:hypothetical protein H7H78_09310 [Mycobacterium shinjukuense]|uniref:Membrane protein n=1 Tax=Mycobacterium shinjukuense TaxID=398694 RepID=A0A7I7MQM8_9MYCO|nr:MmpS family transport accessory protein [Mycobacterium shinjukuense]MCV6985619.1 hypothetical protein [Mycobacterium shinjukuense]ORB71519.1 hypothetical protein BST45_02500 [Mycobacterium shinjukuense]BBX74396.1 membrane protein [Mycobacterium shinjukuense]
MNDPRRPQRFDPQPSGTGPSGPHGSQNPPPTDPAYAGQAPYAPTYSGYLPPWARDPNAPNPTQWLPQYWQQDQTPPGEFPPDGLAPPPHASGAPRWLWVAAGAAVLLVVGLVIALVVANGSAKNQTALEPLPPMPAPSSTLPTLTTRTSPAPSAAPAPTTSGSGTTTETTVAGALQTVVYTVTGEGRAISVTYLDTGGVIQTEFNVSLPWSKAVSLPTTAAHPANVTIVNIGHNVTCSITVAGVQVRQRTGMGLTFCDVPEN